MKKKILGALSLSMILLLSACESFKASNAKTIYLANVGSQTITIKDSSEDDDFDKIVDLCSGTLKNGELDCSFGDTSITFEYDDGKESVVLYPSDDGDYLAKDDISGKTYDYIKLSDDDMKELKKIMAYYGIEFK